MHTQYHQITLKDTFSDCPDMFWDDTPSISSLSMTRLIFFNSFLQIFTRLPCGDGPILWKGSCLLLSLRRSFPFRPYSSFSCLLLGITQFCSFSKVPDARPFKTTFELIGQMFRRLVEYTEQICRMISSFFDDILAFDTSEIELYC